MLIQHYNYHRPVTRQRILVDKHVGDINYDLIGDDAIAREDVPLVGPWTDWTGSAVNVNSANQQQFSSSENQLQGQDAQIVDHAKLPNLSVIGTRVGTHRRRTIKRHAELDKDNQPVNFSFNSTS